jgi:hypothetical protein
MRSEVFGSGKKDGSEEDKDSVMVCSTYIKWQLVN